MNHFCSFLGQSFKAYRPLAVLALAFVSVGAHATCTSLTNGALLAPGASLSLTCSTSNGGSPYGYSTQVVNTPTVPGSYLFGNGFAGSTSPLPGSQPPPDASSSWPAGGFGFYDDWVFTVSDVGINAISTTLDLGSLQLSDLQVRLYSIDGNTLPTLGKPSGTVISAWSAPLSGPGYSGTVVVVPQSVLAAGTYVLEVRGNATGANGGSYSGSMNLTAAPVPLPAAAWLLMSGLLGFVPLVRRQPQAV